MKPLSIIFAGTPAFGLPCLEAIANSEHTLKAIYTQPDRPAGRGRKLQPSPVKAWGLQHNLPIYQPEHFKTPEAVTDLEQLEPDLMVVIAYGLILPKRILEIPTLGCINVHASLLPRWRGASPIQHALLSGDEKTGVTIMQMDEGMDTGDMLTTELYTMPSKETSESLHDALASLAVNPLLEILNQLAEGTASPVSQENEQATYAPKIKKEDARINWLETAGAIDRKIRAFYPWPIAFTQAGDKILRIHDAEILQERADASPGTIVRLDKAGMVIATSDRLLLVTRLQFPGAKAMAVGDWFNAGRDDLKVGMILQ